MTRPIKQEHFADCVAWWGGPSREGREETAQAWRVPIDQIKERSYNLDIKNPHTVAEDHGDPDELLASLQAAEQKASELRDQLKAILAEALLR
jgi:type I restriction enzyme M protein